MVVGVGTADEAAEPTHLMVTALERAGADATSSAAAARKLLEALERVAVPQGSWKYPDPARLVAGGVGAPEARTVLADLGIPQQTLINQALADVAGGRASLVAVVGGEARAWAQRSGDGAVETPQPGLAPDERQSPTSPIVSKEEVAAGLVSPVSQYAMIDNALRAAEGKAIGDHVRELSELWSRFNAVAGGNPSAWFGEPRNAEFLATPGPGNRPLAFPYNKWHASQWTVNQAAALIICSAGSARRHGIPPDRWVFPLVGLESSLAVTLSHRRQPHRWPAMGVLGRAASDHLGRPLGEIGTVETYSCFPAAVRVQQRELGLPLDGTPTITGGMAFSGGPLNNFVYQATAAMVEAVRADAGSMGMVTTVSGLLTKPGLGVWCAEPRRPLLIGDLAAQAETATETVDVVPEHEGRATVISYTVVHFPPRAERAPRLIALLETSGGDRCLAGSEDADLVEGASRRELIGDKMTVRGTALMS